MAIFQSIADRMADAVNQAAARRTPTPDVTELQRRAFDWKGTGGEFEEQANEERRIRELPASLKAIADLGLSPDELTSFEATGTPYGGYRDPARDSARADARAS